MLALELRGRRVPDRAQLESVGEWWTILILRDVFDGLSRFDEPQRNLGISPSMPARRLKAMVDAGLLTKRRYSEHRRGTSTS